MSRLDGGLIALGADLKLPRDGPESWPRGPQAWSPSRSRRSERFQDALDEARPMKCTQARERTVASVDLFWKTNLASGSFRRASAGFRRPHRPRFFSASFRGPSAGLRRGRKDDFRIPEALFGTVYMGSFAKQGPLGIEPPKGVATDSTVHMERDTGVLAFGPSRHRAWVVGQRSLLNAC